MLEFGDIITLENDKKYVVAGTCKYKEKNYVYLVNMEEQTNCVLAIVEKDELQEVEDAEEFKEVMPLILDNTDMSIFEEGE